MDPWSKVFIFLFTHFIYDHKKYVCPCERELLNFSVSISNIVVHLVDELQSVYIQTNSRHVERWKRTRIKREQIITSVGHQSGERLFRIINNWGLEKKNTWSNTMVLALARVTSLLCSDRTLQRLIRWGFVYLGPDRWLKSQKGHVTMLISAVALPFFTDLSFLWPFRTACPPFVSLPQPDGRQNNASLKGVM